MGKEKQNSIQENRTAGALFYRGTQKHDCSEVEKAHLFCNAKTEEAEGIMQLREEYYYANRSDQ